MPRIRPDVTYETQKHLSQIKKLLIATGGPSFNDTGRVIEYCVRCTVQVLNEATIKEREANERREESAGIQEAGAEGEGAAGGGELRGPSEEEPGQQEADEGGAGEGK